MWHRLKPPPRVVDTLLAVVLTVPTVAGLVLDETQPDHPWWVVAPLAAATTLPLAARRTRPIAVLGVTLVATVVLNATGVSTFGPGILVAMYSVGAHVERRIAIRAAGAALVALAVAFVVREGFGDTPRSELVFVAAAWLVGQYIRTRREYLRELEEKADRLERERETSERQAVADEQARIARELHDVIAHNVSVMVVQASGGRELFDRNPERAREALAAIESTGRAALTELRRLLGVARADGGLEPQPGVAQLGALVEQVRSAGLDVDVAVEGDERPLAPGIDLAAYRIVQEALTNTLKHADARRAWVLVGYRPNELVVDVADDGRGSDPSADGRGLIGMRERVSLFGGALEAGPRDDGGFRVHARLPLGTAP